MNIKRFFKIMKYGIKAERDLMLMAVLSFLLIAGSVLFIIMAFVDYTNYGTSEDGTFLFMAFPLGLVGFISAVSGIYQAGKTTYRSKKIKYLRRKKAKSNRKSM